MKPYRHAMAFQSKPGDQSVDQFDRFVANKLKANPSFAKSLELKIKPMTLEIIISVMQFGFDITHLHKQCIVQFSSRWHRVCPFVRRNDLGAKFIIIDQRKTINYRSVYGEADSFYWKQPVEEIISVQRKQMRHIRHREFVLQCKKLILDCQSDPAGVGLSAICFCLDGIPALRVRDGNRNCYAEGSANCLNPSRPVRFGKLEMSSRGYDGGGRANEQSGIAYWPRPEIVEIDYHKGIVPCTTT